MLKYKYNKDFLLAAVLMLVVGLICTFSAFLSYRDMFYFRTHAVEAEGTVIASTETEITLHSESRGYYTKTVYDLTVEYEADGIPFSAVIRSSVSGAEGSRVGFYYDKDNPARIMQEEDINAVFVTTAAVFFSAAGIAMLVAEIKKARYIKGLLERDAVITCYDHYERKSNRKSNNTFYNETVCKYEHNGTLLTFVSYAYHPKKHPFPDGYPIKVAVDLDYPKKYYVIEEDED